MVSEEDWNDMRAAAGTFMMNENMELCGGADGNCIGQCPCSFWYRNCSARHGSKPATTNHDTIRFIKYHFNKGKVGKFSTTLLVTG